MLQLIYASAATVPFTPEALNQLLAKARARNSLFKVSGILVYHAGSFLQVLEGPEEGVEHILQSIYKDPRHANTRTLGRHQIARREFECWSMGFVNTASTFSATAGHIDYGRALASLAETPGRAKSFLRFFQQGLYRQGAAAR